MEENNSSKVYSKVPVKVGFWQRFKDFWTQPVTLELTPKEKKVFAEVHAFWNQEVVVENGEIHLRKANIIQEV